MLILILIGAFLLRIPFLNGSFWLDEAAQALESARPLSQQLHITDDFQPPLIHLLVHFSLPFSTSEWWLRSTAALIPGLITIWATYQIGKRLFSKRVGLTAALLLSSSSFHIFYSQELRPYALPAMFATLSWLSLMELTKNKNRRDVVLFSILTSLGLYSSYLYPFLFLSQVIFMCLFQRKHINHFVIATTISLLSFLPWMPSLLNQLRAGQLLRTQLTGWENIVGFGQLKSLLLIYGKFVFGVIHLETSFPFVIITVMIVTLSGFLFWQAFKITSFRKNIFLLSTWFLVPIVLAWVVSFWIPILQPKRVLFCLPALYLFFSAVAFSQKSLTKNKGGLVLLGLLLCINIFSITQYWINPQYQREDWRSLYTQITQKYASHSAVVIFSFPGPFSPWVWYDTTHFPAVSTGVYNTDQLQDSAELRMLTKYQYLLVFDYLRDLTDPHQRLISIIKNYGYVEVDQITPKTPLGIVHVFAKKQVTIGMK